MHIIRNILLLTVITGLAFVAGITFNKEVIKSNELVQDHSRSISQIKKSIETINQEISANHIGSKVCNNDPDSQNCNQFYTKVAIVDVESVLENSLAIAHIKDFMNSISKQIHNDFSIKEQELKQSEAELIAQRGVLSTEKFEETVSEFNKKISMMQQEKQKKKSALDQAHLEAITDVHNNTVAVIKELSQNYGFNLVLPSSQILFAENNLNITLEVISKLNERLKIVEIKYHSQNSGN